MNLYDVLQARLLVYIPLLLSIAVHEWAHARVAAWLGDRTALYSGRLSLNPLVHIDPVGTLLLPFLGIPFGWAKPVPVEPVRFHRGVSMRWGMFLTAAAGPLSSFLFGVLCAAALATLRIYSAELANMASNTAALEALLSSLVTVNMVLAAFNLLPVPPLDGSHMCEALVPTLLRPAWDTVRRLGPLAIIGVIVVPMFVGIDLLHWPVEFARQLSGAPTLPCSN